MFKLDRTFLALASALLATSWSAVASEEDDAATEAQVLQLIRPHSVIRLGLGHVDGNAARFGRFTGTNESGPVLQLDVDLVTRDEATGTWLRLDGKQLAQDHRELRVEHERQGEWMYYLDYSRIPRFLPQVYTTGLIGIGGPIQQVNGTAPRGVELSTVRDVVTVGLQTQLATVFETQLRFKHEKKTGVRPMGVEGLTFVTEPIDSVAKELEATLGYTGTALQMQAGYLGSWYGNGNRAILVGGGAVVDPLGGGTTPAQISLPLDNAAHQVFVSGGYSLTPTTRATFKTSYERATQNETLHPLLAGPSLVAGQSLDGLVNTALIHAGLSSQPLERLSLLVNIRHEDRDDKTPIRRYLTPSVAFPYSLNTRYSRDMTVGRAEATYRLTREHSLTVGLDHDRLNREVPPSIPFSSPTDPAQARQVSFRSSTEETGYRLELRRSLTDTVNGSLAHVASRRKGSAFLPADNSASPDFIAPINWADRERSKWRLAVDWVPAEPVSVQLVLEDAEDRYSGLVLGPRRGTGRLYSLDLSYALSDDWQLTGWVSQNTTTAEQASCARRGSAATVCTLAGDWVKWAAQLDDRSEAAGLGLRGSPTRKIKLGADLQYAEERNGFAFAVLAPSTASLPAGLPPGIFYKTTSLVSFLEYALAANEGWRLDYVYQRVKTNDWTWNLLDGAGNSLYADGTTVDLSKDAAAQFVGLSYFYRWR